MSYIKRLIQPKIERAIANEKSILLLQPGKTTLLKHQIETDINFSFLDAQIRRRFESAPEPIELGSNIIALNWQSFFSHIKSILTN